MSTFPSPGTVPPPFALRDRQDRTHHSPDAGDARRILFFFKHDCATCALVAPAVECLHRLLSPHGLAALGISQSEADETSDFTSRHRLTCATALDVGLEVSEGYGFDAVPAILLTGSSGAVLASFEGWDKGDWEQLVDRAVAECDAGAVDRSQLDAVVATLPAARPGCGSRVHDPEIARGLAAKRGRSTLVSRRVRLPQGDDPFDFLAESGLTDGLPVVPPTESRVVRMLAGTSRGATDIVATVPPNLVPVTVEKVAVNAVMAGCRPDYLPVVLAAVEAACTSEFNLHGVLATTYFAAPVIVVNGPIRQQIGLNCGVNVFGQGSRANATIGRALQLVVRNVGGGRPGEVDMATLGQPGKFTCCIGENEEATGWAPLHVERGFERADSTVTLFAGEAPRAIRDQLSRSARSLATSIGLSLESIAHVKLHGMGEALLVVSPEHVHTLERDGFSKDDLRAQIQETTARPLRDLLPDPACHKGISIKTLPKEWIGSDGQPRPETLDRPISKFSRPDAIIIVVAGGTAGKFSAVLGGWASGSAGSIAVTRKVTA